jgi:hypothetical protein
MMLSKRLSGEPLRKRPVSERKIQANRRNSRRSPGPKTERGKRTVSRNAITHGFYSKDVVITHGAGAESPEEFQILLVGFLEHYKPVNIVEQFFVEEIVKCLWKKARVTRAENGEICKGLNTLAKERVWLPTERTRKALETAEAIFHGAEKRAREKDSASQRLSALHDAQRNLLEHAMGRLYLSDLLEVAKSEMAVHGHLSTEIAVKISSAFGLWDDPFATVCLQAASLAAGGESTPSSDVGDETSKTRALVVEAINVRREMIKVFEKRAEECESLAEARCLSLPPAEVIDKHIRYGAQANRELYRAMGELERLQRQRKGENVPPPLNVKLE